MLESGDKRRDVRVGVREGLGVLQPNQDLRYYIEVESMPWNELVYRSMLCGGYIGAGLISL